MGVKGLKGGADHYVVCVYGMLFESQRVVEKREKEDVKVDVEEAEV